MSIDVLIKAAEFIERREREAEHGYASTLCAPSPACIASKSRSLASSSSLSTPSTSSAASRSTAALSKRHLKPRRGSCRFTHNELEKNRRANLRVCLERLRDQVPASGDSSRHTTLGLLTRAREFIMMLEDRDRLNRRYKEQLRREQRMLARKFTQISQASRRKKKSLSESSSSATSTASSCSTSSGYSTCESLESPDSDETDSLNSGGAWSQHAARRRVVVDGNQSSTTTLDCAPSFSLQQRRH